MKRVTEIDAWGDQQHGELSRAHPERARESAQ